MIKIYYKELVADFLGSLSISVSQEIVYANNNGEIPVLLVIDNNILQCVALRACIQFFFVASFLWTSCIAFQLFIEVYQ